MILVAVNEEDIPLNVVVDSASVYEGHLAEETANNIGVKKCGSRRKHPILKKPKRVIADKGYDDDGLRKRFAERKIDFIVPYRDNRVNRPYEDGRKLWRYRFVSKFERDYQGRFLPEWFSGSAVQAFGVSTPLQSFASVGRLLFERKYIVPIDRQEKSEAERSSCGSHRRTKARSAWTASPDGPFCILSLVDNRTYTVLQIKNRIGAINGSPGITGKKVGTLFDFFVEGQ